MAHVVAVTGATGNVGRGLVQTLIRNGVSVRAIARNAERLAQLAALGAQECIGDLADPKFVAGAFRGADAVFAMIPEHPAASDFQGDKRRTSASITAAVRAAGVPRVVVLSAATVTPPSGIGPSVANGEFEHVLNNISGLSVVAIRAAFLMENFLASIPLIRTAGINGSVARPDVAFAMVSTRDISAVAAEILTTPKFNGHSVRELLGPRDYSLREATSILGAAIGKPALPYVQFSPEDFRKGIMGAGMSPGLADDLVAMYEAFNEGRIQRMVRRTTANTTLTTLEQFGRDVFAPAFHLA